MDEITRVAYHEAAHTVIEYRLKGDAGPASIIPDHESGSLGHVEDFTTDSSDSEHLRGRILSCYAGGAADQVNGCYVAEQCSSDDEAAEQCFEWLGIVGQSESFRSKALELVKDHWTEIAAVAAELLLHKTLDGTEVAIIADLAAGVDDVADLDLRSYRILVGR